MEMTHDKFREYIYGLLDSRQYDLAKQVLFQQLAIWKEAQSADVILLGELAGFLIDIGSENMDEQAAETGGGNTAKE
jgi:SAM-dependent MidA family methyltransferase